MVVVTVVSGCGRLFRGDLRGDSRQSGASNIPPIRNDVVSKALALSPILPIGTGCRMLWLCILLFAQ